MRNESEHSQVLLFCSKGRIWTLLVRLPGNRSHVCVRCMSKSGYMMGKTAFINVNRAVFLRSPEWLEVNRQDNDCQSVKAMRKPPDDETTSVTCCTAADSNHVSDTYLWRSVYFSVATHIVHHTEQSVGPSLTCCVCLHMRLCSRMRPEKCVRMQQGNRKWVRLNIKQGHWT